MSKSAAPIPAAPPAKLADPAEVRSQLVGKHVCPFCGVLRADPAQPCPRCTLDDSNATRSATKQRIGPWFVLQARNPSAPGMKLATLQSLARRGHLSPRSVVRGPTTEQMWAFVANVRGLSREFGLCYACGEAVDVTSARCPHCGRGQELPVDPDALMETSGPATFSPAYVAPPSPPADMFSSVSVKPSDTGMDGGTSLDLQADPLPFSPPVEPRPTLPAVQPRPAMVQRAAVPPKEEAILTARELAAAFQLDFKSPGNRGGARPRRPVRTLAGLLLIAAIAGGIVLGLREDWRDKSLAWLSQKWGTVAASLEQPAKPAPGGTPPVAPPTATRPPRVDPPAVPVVRDPPIVPTPSPVSPSPAPTPVVERPTPPTPAPTPKIDPPVAPPAPVVVTPPPAPPPVAPTPITPAPVTPPPSPPAAVVETPIDGLTLDQATARASDLRLRAIDAQAKGDWASAVQLYEQIQRLPRDAWPSDLTMRMDVARKRANP